MSLYSMSEGDSFEYKSLESDDDCWDQGFMESIQSDLSKDLEEAGATDIRNLGFLD